MTRVRVCLLLVVGLLALALVLHGCSSEKARATVQCGDCGNQVESADVNFVAGKMLCGGCAAKVADPKRTGEKLACARCGGEFPRGEMMMLNQEYLCMHCMEVTVEKGEGRESATEGPGGGS